MKVLSLTLKRGQHLKFDNGSAMFIKKGISNTYRIVLFLPEEVKAFRSDEYGPNADTKEEYYKHCIEMKGRYERRNPEGKALEASVELEDRDEMDVYNATLPKSGAL